MSSIRDLVVSIDFSDIDIKELLLVDTALNEIESELNALDREIADAGREFAKMGAMATIAGMTAERAMDGAENKTDDAKDELQQFNFNLLTSILRFTALGTVGVVAFSGLVAAGAPLLALVMGLSASLLAAGMAFGAFAAVAIPTLTGLFETAGEIEKIEEKIANAKTAKERIAAQKELAAAMQEVSKEEKYALDALSSFKSFWKDFSKEFEPDVFYIFALALDSVQRLFEGMKPAIHAVSDVMVEMFESVNQSIANGEWQGFFTWLETNGAESLRNFATIGGNLIQGLFNTIAAFSPLGRTIEEKLVSITDKFVTWSANLSQSNGFKTFVEYAQTNGPVLWDTLKNIWQILEDVVKAAAPIGTEVLNAFQWLTDKVKDLTPKLEDASKKVMEIVDGVQNNWPAVRETVIGLTTTVGLFALTMKGLAIIGTINTLMAAWRAGTLLQTAAQMGLNLTMWANPITWVILGITALIAIGVLLYRNWDTVKEKAGELWDAMKVAFGRIGDYFAEKFEPLIDLFDRLKGAWDNFKQSISNFKMPTFKIPTWLGGAGFKADGSHATGLSRVPHDGYKAILHKDEAVLTAKQSNALRSAGILNTSGQKPKLNAGADVVPTGRARSGSTVFSPSVTIRIDGSSGDAREIGKQAATAARREIEKMFTHLGFSM